MNDKVTEKDILGVVDIVSRYEDGARISDVVTNFAFRYNVTDVRARYIVRHAIDMGMVQQDSKFNLNLKV